MYCYYESPVGALTLAENEGRLVFLLFGKRQIDMPYGENDFLRGVIMQLDAYFAGERRSFDIPIEMCGTPFQKKVWTALQSIPYGSTVSYKELAEMIGSPKACRAVGSANNKNPISIIVPCHRVIGADGKLTGYGGGVDNKAYLLKLEQKKER